MKVAGSACENGSMNERYHVGVVHIRKPQELIGTRIHRDDRVKRAGMVIAIDLQKDFFHREVPA
jgi:hypothetical protein